MAEPTCPKCGKHVFFRKDLGGCVLLVYCFNCGHVIGVVCGTMDPADEGPAKD